jgi:hypothetical protein
METARAQKAQAEVERELRTSNRRKAAKGLG